MPTGTSTVHPGGVTPERTRANGQPSVTANRPSVLGRSPTTSSCVARNATDQRARRRPPSGGGAFRRPTAPRRRRCCTAARIAPPPGIGPSRCRVRGVVVGPDQPGAVAHGVGGDAHPLVVELAVEPDDHDVDVGAGRVVAGDRHRADGRDGLGDARTTARQHSLRRFDQRGGGDGRGHHVALGGDADRGEGRLLIGQAGARVVRHEHDPPSGGPQPGDGLDRPGDRRRATATPPRRGPAGTRPVGDHGLGTLEPGVRRTPSVPRLEPFRAVRYAPRTDLDAVIAPPYDVLSDSRRRRAGRPRRAQHRARRRAPGGDDRYAPPAGATGGGSTTACSTVDDRPTLTLYRMRFTDAAGTGRDLVGVLGGAGGRRRGRRRRAPPRAHDAEGVDRSPRPHAGDRRQPLAGVGPVAGRRADGAAGRAGRARRRGRRGRRRARRRAGHRPRPDRRHRRPRRARRRADRRRPPPLRRGPHPPRRGPGLDGPPRHGGRGHPGLRRRAGRRAAQHRGDPSPVPGRAPTTSCARVLAHCFDLEPAPDPAPATAGRDGGRARAPGARRPGRRAPSG